MKKHGMRHISPEEFERDPDLKRLSMRMPHNDPGSYRGSDIADGIEITANNTNQGGAGGTIPRELGRIYWEE